MRYDANGNMVTENDDTFGYNGDNQLVSRTEGDTTITYVYDGQGNLVKKSSSDGTPVVYIGGIYEVHQDGSYVTYYGTFGRRIAMRLHEGGGDSGSLHFLLADQVGSTSSIIDEGGSVEESAKYYPFGSLRSGGLELSDRAFTGQQDEGGGFGLYDYGARFYSSIIGRFVSADPIGGQGDPQTIDRYSYVRNNPLRNIDPTGLVCSPTGGLGDCSQEELDWWTAEHQKQDPGCCETGSLKWLADWINNLMTGPLELSRDQALTRIQLTAYWADYYRNAVAAYHENSKVDPGNETTWLIALSMQCPGCFSDIHWIPEFNPNNEIPRSGGVVGMAEPWMCNNQPGCWTTPDPEVTSTNNPDWVNWANLTLMTYVWLRDDVLLSPEEIAIMPWSGPQRHQISFTFPMPGTRNFFDSTIDTIWESLPDIIWNFY
jgi:RHS repeat-associated protein